MRSQLNLTDVELMNKSWIALNLEMMDFPYYEAKEKPRENDMSFLNDRMQ